MKYIIKYFLPSRYYMFKRVVYEELKTKEEVLDFINKKKLDRKDYEIFIRVI